MVLRGGRHSSDHLALSPAFVQSAGALGFSTCQSTAIPENSVQPGNTISGGDENAVADWLQWHKPCQLQAANRTDNWQGMVQVGMKRAGARHGCAKPCLLYTSPSPRD
eukprot:1576109-Alexandrium_andersonii.AAC.1